MKRCVVSADDYALSAGVDEAILALIDQGVLTATSCLTGSPRWAEAARSLRRLRSGVADLGVHVDLTEFERVAPSHAGLVAACITRSVNGPVLRAILKGQFERFEEALGRAPDYVDGHRHVHQLPIVRDALVELLAQRYPARPPWVRVSLPGAGAPWKAKLIGALGGAGLAAQCGRAQVPHSRRLHGIYDFSADLASHRARLGRWLARMEDGDALMCHPATRAEPADPIGAARRNEFDVLSSAWWTEALATHGIQARRGSQCVAGRLAAL